MFRSDFSAFGFAGLGLAGALSLLVACGPSSSDDLPLGPDGGERADEGGADAGIGFPQADAAPPAVNAEVYAHSADTLYRLNPETLAVEVIGQFDGCSNVIDLAVDRNSRIIATTSSGLHDIDSNTAACTLISEGSYPNSLSFVPVGVLDPVNEVLVAYRGSDYIRIDPNTGDVTTIGSLEGGLFSSGDVVSVEGGGTYLTATGGDCDDCLLEINPVDGSLVQNLGNLPYTSVWGLAYWGGIAYGFDDSGAAFTIDFSGGSATTSEISIPGAPSGLSFWGAGSTTIAPTID